MNKELLDHLGVDLNDELLTVDEVAKFLKCNRQRVYRMIDSGFLPCLKLGRIKVMKSSLIRLLKKYEGCDISNPEGIIYLDKGAK